MDLYSNVRKPMKIKISTYTIANFVTRCSLHRRAYGLIIGRLLSGCAWSGDGSCDSGLLNLLNCNQLFAKRKSVTTAPLKLYKLATWFLKNVYYK